MEKEVKKVIYSNIWCCLLNFVVNNICKLVVFVWKKINKMVKSMKIDLSKVYKKN